MPLTYVSHQVPVLALKMRWTRHFDGVGLVMGSMAPDAAFVFVRTPLAFRGHSGPGVLRAVLIGVVAAYVVRGIAPTAFRHLDVVPRLRMERFTSLADHRPGVLVTVWSVAVGAATHIGWDLFTHDERWLAEQWALLTRDVVTIGPRTFSVAGVLQYVGHIGGLVVGMLLIERITRDRPASAVPTPTVVERTWFWVVVGATATIGSVSIALSAGTAFRWLAFQVPALILLGVILAARRPGEARSARRAAITA